MVTKNEITDLTDFEVLTYQLCSGKFVAAVYDNIWYTGNKRTKYDIFIATKKI
jgi:hypothetical protein